MKKLKLNLDDIKVESFITDEHQNAKGTVNGQALACDTLAPCGSGGGGGGGNGSVNVCSNNAFTCVGNTCGAASCGGTCVHSCGPGTCLSCEPNGFSACASPSVCFPYCVTEQAFGGPYCW